MSETSVLGHPRSAALRNSAGTFNTSDVHMDKVYTVHFVWDEGWTPLYFASTKELALEWIRKNPYTSEENIQIEEHLLDN